MDVEHSKWIGMVFWASCYHQIMTFPWVGVLVSTAQDASSFANFSQVNVFSSGQGAGKFCIPLDFSKSNVTGLQTGQNVTIQVSQFRWSRLGVHSTLSDCIQRRWWGIVPGECLYFSHGYSWINLVRNSVPILHSRTTSTYLQLSHAQTVLPPVAVHRLRVLFLLWQR